MMVGQQVASTAAAILKDVVIQGSVAGSAAGAA